MRRMSAALLVAMVLGACGTGEPTTTSIDLGVEHFDALDSPVLSADEINGIIAGNLPAPDFNSDPATSGPHADTWARCGIYRQEIPDIYLVASMNRGAVVVHYEPALEPSEIDSLGDLARDIGEGVIVAPRPGLSAPIVLTAWTTLLELRSLDADAIRAFVDQYGHQSPDDSPCPLEIDEAA